MQEFNVDFHIHSKYSGGTSKSMELPLIAKQAELKGLHLVGTGDALNPSWMRHMKHNLSEEEEGVYSIKKSMTRFLVTTEVEDSKRVHHVILFPSISSAESLMEEFRHFSSDIERDGRPHLRLNGEQIVDYAKEAGALVGPAHAFTPWTAMYKEYDSISGCYGDNTKEIKFLELGLSADTSMADRIPELEDITFMTNSDAHSPWPQRLGREFNRVSIKELSFNEINKAIERKGDGKFILNVGLNPREGKYHLTACSRCFLRFRLEDALKLKWRCPECRGLIKKGVSDRINELATRDKPLHPGHRPGYIHILPLAEVISLATGIRTLNSKTIGDRWDKLVENFRTEINVLVDIDVDEIKKVDPSVGKIIDRFRTGRMRYVAGGGGQYGRPTLKDEEDNFYGSGQKSLTDF
ncbi:MAG: TIGR00375 family protein [Candidatus Altiarchaeota archaeon]|nr:TIGR00375 family protein [Candidatus Altiarchaeota archaeon]